VALWALGFVSAYVRADGVAGAGVVQHTLAEPEGYLPNVILIHAYLCDVVLNDVLCDNCRDFQVLGAVKLLPVPHTPVRARTDAGTNPSAQRATQLRSVIARVYTVSIQNQITTTVL
jgi:hypothetical protein